MVSVEQHRSARAARLPPREGAPRVPARGPLEYPGRGLHGEIVETIGERIVMGAYAPGDLLLAEDLGAELGVSKTVIRESLKVLAARGLVDSRPKRGTVVRPREAWSVLDADLLLWRGRGVPDAGFLRDLSEVRLVIEPEAARLAAQRRDDSDLELLSRALTSMEEAGQAGAALVAADVAFHSALLRAAHNELLSRLEVVISTELRVRDQLVHKGVWRDSVPDHRAIFEAIRLQRPDGAAAATRLLIDRAALDTAAYVRDSQGNDASQSGFEP